MKTKITQNIKSIILALVLVAGVGYVSAQSVWTNPGCGPTGCNTPTPINVGGGDVGITQYSQHKTGLITLDHLFTGDFTVASLTPIIPGQVLTAVDTTGKVGWGSGAIPTVVVATSGSWTVPPGVTKIAVAVWGGGGSNGKGTVGCDGSRGGNGGFGESVFSVVPGQSYTITIGNGGNLGNGGSGIGGSSSFGSLISASGGSSGISYICNDSDGSDGTVNSTMPLIGPALYVGGNYLNAGKGGTTTVVISGINTSHVSNGGQNGQILIAY